MAGSAPEELTKARNTAVRLLARRAHAVAELEAKLAKRRFAPSVIRQTIEHLCSLGYLDDGAFARSQARYLMEFRPMGRKRLAWELTRKGLDRSLVEKAVDEVWEGRSERSVALALAKRRLEAYRGLPLQKAKRRLKDYLGRRGFALEDIFSVLDEFFAE
jgi:regulatory protein